MREGLDAAFDHAEHAGGEQHGGRDDENRKKAGERRSRLSPDPETHVDPPGGQENGERDRGPANPGEERPPGVRVHLRPEDRSRRPPRHARGVVDAHPPAAHPVLHDLIDPAIPGGEEQGVSDAQHEPEREPHPVVPNRGKGREHRGHQRQSEERRPEEAEARDQPRRAPRHEHDSGELGGRVQPDRGLVVAPEAQRLGQDRPGERAGHGDDGERRHQGEEAQAPFAHAEAEFRH